MHKNPIWDPTWSKMASQNGRRPAIFSGFSWYLLQNASGEAPVPPKSLRINKRHDVCVTCFMQCCTHTCCTCGLAAQLYLSSLGKVRMLTQYPQIAWGCGDDPTQASSIRTMKWHNQQKCWCVYLIKNPISKRGATFQFYRMWKL